MKNNWTHKRTARRNKMLARTAHLKTIEIDDAIWRGFAYIAWDDFLHRHKELFLPYI